MKKIATLFLLTIFLSGCAYYKFQLGQEPYDKGYVASRDDYVILEYTLGEDNSVPSKIALAKERFRRRRKIVEHYYKKMDFIENRFKMAFWNPSTYFLKAFFGVFRLPFIAVSDYRYRHNPEYREKFRESQREKDAKEEEYINKLKAKLKDYIEKDLLSEGAF